MKEHDDVGSRWRTSIKFPAIMTGLFCLWAIDAPTSMGNGGLLIMAPIVFIVTLFVANIFRWITGIK